MTEAAFQAARKVMAKANYIRGKITTAKGNVAKWTNIEDDHRRNLRTTRADGAKVALDRALLRLEEERKKLAALKFPDNDLEVAPVGKGTCEMCSRPIDKTETYCEDCKTGN